MPTATQKQRPGPTPKTVPAELIERYARGELSLGRLAEAAGVAPTTAARCVREAGVPLRSHAESARIRPLKPVPAEVIDGYLRGELSAQRAAALAGCTRKVVRRHVLRAGLPVRGKSAAARLRMRKNEARDAAIREMRAAGRKVAEVAQLFGVTEQRVSQIAPRVRPAASADPSGGRAAA